MTVPQSRLRIDTLTGLRFFAAICVVLFHIRGNLQSEFPAAYSEVEPIIAYSEFGVDLFFGLSGFVLALAYSGRLGGRWSWKATGEFYWARFARIWPAYFFMLLVVTVWHFSFVWRGIPDPVAPRDLGLGSFIRQTFMVILWTEPSNDRLTWNGAAWTVSAEVLAYLIFPIAMLLIDRRIRHLRAPALALMSVMLMLPLGILSVRYGLYAPWMWTLRIGCAFSAGYVAYFLLLRVKDWAGAQRWSGAVVGIGLIGAFFWLALCLNLGRHQLGNLVVVFPLFLVALALGRDWIARLTELPPAQLGGRISYSIYLVHMPLIEVFWYLQTYYADIFGPDLAGSKVGLLLIPVVATLLGYLLWLLVEEPSRKLLKKVVS